MKQRLYLLGRKRAFAVRYKIYYIEKENDQETNNFCLNGLLMQTFFDVKFTL